MTLRSFLIIQDTLKFWKNFLPPMLLLKYPILQYIFCCLIKIKENNNYKNVAVYFIVSDSNDGLLLWQPWCQVYLVPFYRAFSLTWPASMQISWDKRKRLHKKRVQLPKNFLGTPTWPPFHCFGTPIWPPWRHVKTLYSPETISRSKKGKKRREKLERR